MGESKPLYICIWTQHPSMIPCPQPTFQAQNALRNMAKEAADPDKELHDELLAEEDEKQSKKNARKGAGRGKGRGKGRGGKGKNGGKGRGKKQPKDGNDDAPGSETFDVDEPEHEKKDEHTASATVDELRGEDEMGESRDPKPEVLDRPSPPKRKKSKIVERKLKRLKMLSPSSSGKKANQNPAHPREVNAVPEDAVEGDLQNRTHKGRRGAKKRKSKAVSEKLVQDIPEVEPPANFEHDKEHEGGNGKPAGEDPENEETNLDDSEEKQKEEEKVNAIKERIHILLNQNAAITQESGYGL